MDTKKFYGTLQHVANIDSDESDDPDLSGDEAESCVNSKIQTNQNDPDPESDYSSDDDMPLSEIRKRISKNIEWHEGNLLKNDNEIQFRGSPDLPDSIRTLATPVEYFKFLFPKELISYITEQSNLYNIQCQPHKPVHTTSHEIEQFIGICILTSTRDYWNGSLGHPAVSEVMSCNRFETIKRFIHFNDNSQMIQRGQPGHDKLFKIRPFLTQIRERLLLVPREEHLAIDEQIIPTKARSQIKQYNPKKPHKWGYKNFVLSGISGFSYDFDLFAGSQSNQVPNGRPNLGVSSNVVIRLSESVPRNNNYKLFFDNWFTSIPLMIYLHKEGILPLGTVRANRIPCTLPSEKDMKETGRGTIKEKISRIDNVDIATVSWYDNKVVTTLSTYVGSEPRGEKKRFFKKENTHKMIECPRSVFVYNNYMGGVDLLDAMLGFYRIKIRSKKWYLRIFFHMLDLCCVNAWLLWRRSNKEFDLPLKDFKLAIADSLCNANKEYKRRVGRPSAEVQTLYAIKKKRGPTKEIPQQEVRLDGIDHLPEWSEQQRSRCKFPLCEYKSFVSCTKCKVFLCFNKDRNFFGGSTLNK